MFFIKQIEMTTFERGGSIGFISIFYNCQKCSEMYSFRISAMWKFKTIGNADNLPRTDRHLLEPKHFKKIVKDDIQTE